MGAGICNITATFYGTLEISKSASLISNGAVTVLRNNKYYMEIPNECSIGGAQYSFNAARVNNIYGNSNTVTPMSLSTKFFIKY